MGIQKEEKSVILAYLAVCIVWGSTYLAIRIGVSEFPPELFAGVRFLIAGGLMLLYARLKKMEFPNKFTDIRRISTVGLFLLLGGNGLVVWAEQWVHSGATSLLVATGPLWMAIMELFIPGEKRLGILGWIGLMVGFGGVMMLVSTGAETGAIDIKGSLVILTSTFLWASGSIYSKRFKTSGSTVAVIGTQMLAGGIGLTLTGLLLGEASRVQFSARGIGALLYLIFFGSIIGYSSYIYILKKWPAPKAGTYAYVNPVIAVLLGAIVLGEPLSLTVVISTLVILAGVLLVQLSKTHTVAESSFEIKETF